MSDVPRPTYDWRDQRYAMEKTYAELGWEKKESDWAFIATVLKHFEAVRMSECCECGQRIHQLQTIRCLDCKAALCERCAPKHFWPNGRST